MVSIRISVDHDLHTGAERFAEYPEKIDRATVKATERATDHLKEQYVDEIPKRTGRTAGTIGSHVESRPGGATGYVGTDDQIAQYLEYGTRPHRIEPRNAKALRFEVGSQTIFAKYVNHPGTKPHNSLLRAAQLSRYPTERYFADELGDVFR